MYKKLSDGSFEKTSYEYQTKEDIKEKIKSLESGIELRLRKIVELRVETAKEQEEMEELRNLLKS